jgi:hypothetical protein
MNPSPVQIQIHGRVSSLMNTYYRLSKGCDEMAFVDRHIPFSKFRQHVRKLDRDTRGLFNDTLVKFPIYTFSFDVNLIMSIALQATTVPYLDDMGFDPKNPGLAMDRSSSSESSITFPIPNHPASSTIVESTLPYSRNILVN